MDIVGSLGRVVASLILLGIGVGGFFWLGTPEVPTRPPERKDAPLVRTSIAEEHTDGIQFQVDGVVVPFRQVAIAAQVAGRIQVKAENCRTGRAVKEGDLLLEIDPRDYQLEVRRLSEELEQADAMLSELNVEIATAENQIELAQQQLEIDVRQLQRNKDLLATRAASESELDAARRDELNSRSALQTLQDQKNLLSQRVIRLQSAEALVQANLEKAELALERTKIRAPFDGVVVSDNVEKDGYVQTGDVILSLQDTSQLDVTCKLHMRQMNWLWQSRPGDASQESLLAAYDFPQTPATVIFDLGDVSYQWRGVVNRYDGAGIDNQTRMVPCRVNVDQPLSVLPVPAAGSSARGGNPPSLMTGMFVKVRIDARPPIPLVRLPQQAIQPGNAIWTVDKGKLKRKEVLIANSGPEFVVAYQQAGGLQAGDAVVVSPLATPIEGIEVKQIGSEDAGPAARRNGNETAAKGDLGPSDVATARDVGENRLQPKRSGEVGRQ